MNDAPGPEGGFDLDRFLPYLLDQAAEATSRSFHATYKGEYGMTRTQWRVIANLGKLGGMTARHICRIAHIEKTKVSRAVAALEERNLLVRVQAADDRRAEILSLTPAGRDVFQHLGQRAIAYDRALRDEMEPETAAEFESLLRRLIARGAPEDDDE
jgi:DNA-binding MarR family transcriptional regulator